MQEAMKVPFDGKKHEYATLPQQPKARAEKPISFLDLQPYRDPNRKYSMNVETFKRFESRYKQVQDLYHAIAPAIEHVSILAIAPEGEQAVEGYDLLERGAQRLEETSEESSQEHEGVEAVETDAENLDEEGSINRGEGRPIQAQEGSEGLEVTEGYQHVLSAMNEELQRHSADPSIAGLSPDQKKVLLGELGLDLGFLVLKSQLKLYLQQTIKTDDATWHLIDESLGALHTRNSEIVGSYKDYNNLRESIQHDLLNMIGRERAETIEDHIKRFAQDVVRVDTITGEKKLKQTGIERTDLLVNVAKTRWLTPSMASPLGTITRMEAMARAMEEGGAIG